MREFRAGYAEVVKYGLINDRAFFEWLEAHWRGVFAGGPDQVHAIAKSCAAKAAIVAADEHEAGERALLNLGHTFAHAFERIVHYDNRRLVHGEAVAIGLACAFRFSAARGLCAGRGASASSRLICAPSACRPRSAIFRAGTRTNRRSSKPCIQDKKVQARRADFHPGAWHRPIASSPTMSRPADVRAFLATELTAPKDGISIMHGAHAEE